MTGHRAAVIFLSILGWISIAGAGWLAFDEYVTLHSGGWFSDIMEGFIWKAVIALAIIGIGLVIGAGRLRSREGDVRRPAERQS